MSKSEVQSPGSVSEVYSATDDQLKHCLMTPDGKGYVIKRACLDELLKREYKKGWDDHKGYSREGDPQ